MSRCGSSNKIADFSCSDKRSDCASEKNSEHRKDVQGLRAVAISAVLLFHVWPRVAPVGFLGVDVFFVISGYLIAKCLAPAADVADPLLRVLAQSLQGLPPSASPSTPVSPRRRGASLSPLRQQLFAFYFRRVRRILPAFAFVVYATTSVARLVLGAEDWAELRADLRWSLAFSENMHTFFGAGDDYFAKVRSYSLLVHMWSLSVEMQFYLLAPVLFLFAARRHRRWPLIGVFVVSFLLQSCAPLPRSLAFGLVFCRLWQFTGGALAFYHYEKCAKNKASVTTPPLLASHIASCKVKKLCSERGRRPSAPTLCLFGLLAALFCTNPFSVTTTPQQSSTPAAPHTSAVFWRRVFVTLFAAVFLAVNNEKSGGEHSCGGCVRRHRWSTWLLSNCLAQKLGWVSYALYLVHWPALTLVRYHFNVDMLGAWEGLALVGCCIALSVGVETTFQRFRLAQSVCLLVGLFYAATFVQMIPAAMDNEATTLTKMFLKNADLLNASEHPSPNHVAELIGSNSPSGLELARLLIYNHYILGRKYAGHKERSVLTALLNDARTIREINRLMERVPVTYDWDMNAISPYAANDSTITAPVHGVWERTARGDGNASVLLVGNSFTPSAWSTFFGVLRPHVDTFRGYAIVGCDALPVLDALVPKQIGTEKGFNCPGFVKTILNLVRLKRPDIVILYFYWDDAILFEKASFPIENDPMLRLWQRFFDELLRHTKHVFIVRPIPPSYFSVAAELVKRLDQGAANESLHQLHLTHSDFVWRGQHVNQRLNALRCANSTCTMLDFASPICDESRNVCLAFDEETRFAYYFDKIHPSYAYLCKIMWIVREVGETITKIV